MRFLLDESLSPRVAEPLRAAGHDVVHAREIGLTSAPDPVVLQAAVEDRRVLLTLDTDFGTLLARSGDSLPSVVLFRGEVTRLATQIDDAFRKLGIIINVHASSRWRPA